MDLQQREHFVAVALMAARAASETPDLLAIAHVEEDICWELVVAYRELDPERARRILLPKRFRTW